MFSAWDATLSVHAILREGNPLRARYPCGNWGQREARDRTSPADVSPGSRSGASSEPGERESARLACKARVVYHREHGRFPTTRRRALASLAQARGRRGGMKIPGDPSRGVRVGTSSQDPAAGPAAAGRPEELAAGAEWGTPQVALLLEVA